MKRSATLILISLLFIAPIARAAPVDFDKQIRPLLAEHCLACHGPDKSKGSLRLDQKDLALDGGESGKVILPGHAEQSLLVKLLRGPAGDADQMPKKKDPLPPDQIALISRWIDEGAIWPKGPPIAAAKHWSFLPPARPPVPTVTNAAWPKNPIDAFVLSRLEHEQINPAPQASKETLIRRVSLDLTGLPPSVAEIDAFLADASPNAYETLVDRLLASPHYGERWARHWLDGARYADSNGYSLDNPRSIWPYRDWVINALNRDEPFDQFTIDQLAGDLLPGATLDQKVATGFHRNTQINEEGGIDPEQFRVEAIVDRVGTTGTVFLGLTVACAQCHNHKFDPISQREYYRLFAFFNNADEPKLKVKNAVDEQQAAFMAERLKQAEDGFRQSREAVADRISAWEAALTPAQKEKLDAAAQKALKAPAAKRTPKQKEAVAEAFLSLDAEYTRKRQEYLALKQEADGVTTLVMQERMEPRQSWIFIKGDFTRHGDEVTPGVPEILPPLPATRPTRLDLAKWIVDPANPLTARVQVNRTWMQFFGRGLVETENDFGTQGTKPTNPALLDWLATEFTRQGWSTKALHRLIVTSAAYRQSSTVRPELLDRDPYNRLIARQSRIRLDAEVVRDAELVASGLFSPKIGGPSVFPPQPDGVTNVGQVKRLWKPSPGEDRYRRGLYTWVWRMSPHPLLTSFDAPDATLTCTRRNRSNTPLQALTLLNDSAFTEFAQALAARTLKESTGDEPRVTQAFRLCTGRTPDPDETKLLLGVLTRSRASLANEPAEAKRLCAGKAPPGVDEPEFAAWVMASRVMLNVDEAITRE